MADVKKIIKGVFDLPEHLIEAVAPLAYSPEVLNSTMRRLADKISGANPKMSEAEVLKRATTQATKKLDWERVHKPALQKTYGDLADASYSESAPSRLRNTPQVVEERKRKANEFLDQPTEPWVPPKPELQAFDRSSIKDALEGFPGVEQSSFPRDVPTRANISHVEELYNDPENRELIKKQIMRGLPLGGESFYASLYPIKQAVLEAGMPASKFDSWIHGLAPASARNSIMNEMAVGQFLRNMNAQGLPLDEATVAKQMAEFKKQFGMGLPLMPIHRTGVQNVLENNVDLREHNLANIPTNYKIPTYGTQKAGDFGKSVVLDVHEAAGQSQGSRYHPYFNEAGGFGNTEYNAGEQGLLGIAKELGLPGGMAQAGRWFGGGELTGLRSPRGDALDLLEKQYAYTLQQQGRQPNPANIRAEVLKQIETGEGTLLPWYKKEGMPDMRTTGLQRKDGGQVEHMQSGGLKTLFGEILNKGGAYAARRLERAADEIPNLEKLYQQEALRRAFMGDNAEALMTIKPSEFENYAAPLTTTLSKESKKNIANLQNIQGSGGFSDVPFLYINKEKQGSLDLPWITTHEGRHRNRAMDAAGEQAGLVSLLPRRELREPFPRRTQEQYIEALKKEMDLTGNKVKPEKYYDANDQAFERPAIDLPDLYAEGGAVHMQMGGMTPEPPGGTARQETFESQHVKDGGDIMRSLFDHALDKGDIHEMTHAMLVKQHEAEYG